MVFGVFGVELDIFSYFKHIFIISALKYILVTSEFYRLTNYEGIIYFRNNHRLLEFYRLTNYEGIIYFRNNHRLLKKNYYQHDEMNYHKWMTT